MGITSSIKISLLVSEQAPKSIAPSSPPSSESFRQYVKFCKVIGKFLKDFRIQYIDEPFDRLHQNVVTNQITCSDVLRYAIFFLTK